VVSRISLGPLDVSDPPPAEAFAETLQFGRSNLWVVGHEIEGPILVKYSSEGLYFGEVLLALNCPEISADSIDDARRDDVYAKVPRYKELRAAGKSIRDAKQQYSAELGGLYSQVTAAYMSGGHAAAAAAMRNNALFTDVEDVADGTFRYRRAGLPLTQTFRCARVPPVQLTNADRVHERDERARRLVSVLKTRLLEAPTLVVVECDGSFRALGGSLREQGLAQLRHAAAGLPRESLPAGPLSSTEVAIRDAYIAAEALR
jgi:rhodanese-related sulfurtransferase